MPVEQKYIFTGVIHPQRAMLQDRSLKVYFGMLGHPGKWYFEARILCNQLVAYVTTDVYIDEYVLKSHVEGLINDELARLAFTLGYEFKLSLDRAINRESGLDRVFGIDNAYISEIMAEHDFEILNQKLRSMTVNAEGTFFSRALTDLKSALSNRDDAAFYCFRALESLRNHFNFVNELTPNKDKEWVQFREFLNITREDIISKVKVHSDAMRHGHPVYLDEGNYKSVLTTTWLWVLEYVYKMTAESQDK